MKIKSVFQQHGKARELSYIDTTSVTECLHVGDFKQFSVMYHDGK